jgi:hypothetical protein
MAQQGNPSILTWNRLEARPRKTEFDRVLRAEVRDALWFLTRQWQFGEFKGEDAGTAVQTRIEMETSRVDHISLRGNDATAYNDNLPMESQVERDRVPLDLTLRQAMGAHWERVLRQELAAASVLQATIDSIVADIKSNINLHFSPPTPTTGEEYGEVYGDPNIMMVYEVISNGRALDGGELYENLVNGTLASSYCTLSLTGAQQGAIDAAGIAFVDWFRKTYSHPASATDTAWDASRLEYQFACSAPKSQSDSTILVAEEYASGHLDWYNFDIEHPAANLPNNLDPANPDTSLIKQELLTVLPRGVEFPGMPHPRWWQMEEGQVNLGVLNTDTTDVAKLLFGEFALIFSNDWMVAPFDVPTGSICEVKSMIVNDVFGLKTVIRPAGAGDQTDWRRWSMFNLHRRGISSGAADQRLFIPPSAIQVFESEPVERVNMVRDEMANMVWGIETQVPDGLGGGMDGFEASLRLVNYLKEISTATPPPAVSNDADIRYLLGTTVPENWIPFIPSRVGGVNSRAIQLRRAAMPRIIEGETPVRIRPRTELLREGYDSVNNIWGAYHIHEEEVPRSGAIVKRTWQRTRWNNGAAVTWLGRRKTNGRGQGNSGLEFDAILPKEA